MVEMNREEQGETNTKKVLDNNAQEDNKNEDGNIKESPEKNLKKNKRIKKMIWAVVIIAGIVALSIIPGMIAEKKAQAAVAEFTQSYEQRLAAGDYEALSKEAEELLAENERHLSLEERTELASLESYAEALGSLDFIHGDPTSESVYSYILSRLEDADGYGVSDTLISFIETYQDEAGDIEGVVVVSPKNNKDDDSVSAVESDSIIIGTVSGSARYNPAGNSGEAGASVHYDPKNSIYYNYDTSEKEDDKEEEKPKEYPCSGVVHLGFEKDSTSNKINESSIREGFVLRIELSDEIKEIDCKSYEGIVYLDEMKDFTLTGVNDKTATIKGEFDGSLWFLDFGNGITASLGKPNETDTYDSSDSYDSYDSPSSKKDYSDGSDWENYDKDKNGQISDDEFQDATNDYMDNYYDNNDSDYEAGSDWEQYDSDYNGKIDDNEFQDAVGDWMDSNGY